MEEKQNDTADKSKAIRLIDFLTKIASLRVNVTRDVNDYTKVLWINDIPRQKGCFARAWGSDEEFASDVWIEVRKEREPEPPSVPALCKPWADKSSLKSKNDGPVLLTEITNQVRNPAWQNGSDESKYVPRNERLHDHPEVRLEWDEYVDERWLPWTDKHNAWESTHRAYSALFAIRQEQLRLGEEYELVLGLGLLVWRTPDGQHVRRHLVTANATLEFDESLGVFTVGPMPDGARLRPELDMIDIQHQPPRAEEEAKSALAKGTDDPWESECVNGVLQALAHSLSSDGEFHETLEAGRTAASSKPIVEYAPALILRKRSAKGLTEALCQIREQIELGGAIPGEFADLAEIGPPEDRESEHDPGETDKRHASELFFPKPSNDEQRRIVDKLNSANGVLVQGPPGTGKSHTIANLICHLLATGRRILVTAKTPRALEVLQKLLPEELRPLCINLLGNGLEEKKSLESSVSGILRKNDKWSGRKWATAEINALEEQLRRLREENAAIARRLLAIREAETHAHSIADGTYRGSAARIVEAVKRDRPLYEWFTDIVSLDKSCPCSESELHGILAALRDATPKKRREISLAWPDAPLTPERLATLFTAEARAIEDAKHAAQNADAHVADQLSKIDAAAIQALHDQLAAFQSERRRLLSSTQPWMRDAVRDVVTDNSSTWRELSRVTLEVVSSIESLVAIVDEISIDFPSDVYPRALYDDVCKLREHVADGGKLGFWLFRPKAIKNTAYILSAVRMNGRRCRELDQFKVLADALYVRLECDRAWKFWEGQCDRVPGPYALQLQAFKSICNQTGVVLFLAGFVDQCRQALNRCGALVEPIWTDEPQIEGLMASCRLGLANQTLRFAIGEIRRVMEVVEKSADKGEVHPITSILLQAIGDRDLVESTRAWNGIQGLNEERQKIQELDTDMQELGQHVPRLAEKLEHNCDDPLWEDRLRTIQSAWRWAQGRLWVEEYIRKEDAPGLEERAKQIEDDINTIVAKLASLRAWSICFSRLTGNHRQHMEAWQQSMKHLGKGTGKYAVKHRREAQYHLNECRESVPAWVMPLYRVWDTVPPAPKMFDVIIVDEASQCGLEALPLLYLGKKILIVGDDQQISPEAVGLQQSDTQRLAEQLLGDFEFKSSYDIQSSLFDHGKLRYGTQRITLREHFRSMPEIIRFSNDLCYCDGDSSLIPLRQYGPDRLKPLEHEFVPTGYREGDGNRVVNRPEAEAAVNKIVELCRDSRYAGKTMGLIVLQGEAQAGLIEEQLLERLGAEEMERRRLICGNAYSFQGDERDIVFLSMVAAPNERIGPFVQPKDERRFNVAASRARDQMWLFHSVRCEDLSPSCLRRRLLEFFENTQPQTIAGISRVDLERRATLDNRAIIKAPQPFDSWFEVDVALALLRKGFNVVPQYEVAGKRIDLVVEGGHARLAVECDGEYWHGPEQCEKDMERQRMLERCKWEFFRVRESAFYADRECSLQRLWRLLEERGILPRRLQEVVLPVVNSVDTGTVDTSDEESYLEEHVDENAVVCTSAE